MFTPIKNTVIRMALLTHCDPLVPISPITGASDIAVRAVMQQYIDSFWNPSAFFSTRLRSSESRYNMSGRELLAEYPAVSQFGHIFGRAFKVLRDHKQW